MSAAWSAPHGTCLPALTIVGGRLAGSSDGDDAVDPIRPESIRLTSAPQRVGRMSRRQAERKLRPLLHPDRENLLGFAGAAVPYWTLTGERASVAVVAPAERPAVVGTECRFRWRNTPHVLPVLPTALATCPPRPRRLLVALSPPRAGHCYKVVAGLL